MENCREDNPGGWAGQGGVDPWRGDSYPRLSQQ